MKVKDTMHKGIACVAPDASVADVAKLMLKQDVGAIPVKENGKLLGMITDRDIAMRAVADGKDTTHLKAREVMTPSVFTCHESEDVTNAIHLMESKKIRRLPVLNDGNDIVGMLSVGDISHAASGTLTAEVMKAVSAHHR